MKQNAILIHTKCNTCITLLHTNKNAKDYIQFLNTLYYNFVMFCSIKGSEIFIYNAPSVYRPPFYRQPRLSPKFTSVSISPIKNPCYTAKLSYRHLPQVFRHKSRKTNLNSPVSTTHNYLLTAVYRSVIMECQNWSSDTVIDLIVEGRNRWSIVLIRIITCIYFSSDYICTFNLE